MSQTETPALSSAVICTEALKKIQTGDALSAVKLLKGVLSQEPENTQALQFLSSAYGVLDQTDQQRAILTKLGAQNPDDLIYLLDSSSLEARVPGGGRRAVELCKKAAALHPENAFAFVKYGIALMEMRRYEAAEAIFWQALARFPQELAAWLYLAELSLARGDVTRGMAFSNHRHMLPSSIPTADFAKSGWRKWHGEALSQDTCLYIYADVDQSQVCFLARYLPAVADLCPNSVIINRPGVTDFLQYDSRWQVTTPEPQSQSPSPRYVIMSDLPGVFQGRVDLHKTPFDFAALRQAHTPLSLKNAQAKSRNVAVVWSAGQTADLAADSRAFLTNTSARMFLPLFENTAHTFFSFSPVPQDVAAAGVTDLSAQIKTPSDLVSALLSMDAVVSVESVLAHLSASMGLKTCVVVPYHAPWTWGIDGASPYYPKAHVCRQSTYMDWPSAINAVQKML